MTQTIHVGADGAVTYGVTVRPVRAGERVVAAAPLVAHGFRFSPNRMPGTPEDERRILAVTAPHDCRNHIPAFEDEDARAARLVVS